MTPAVFLPLSSVHHCMLTRHRHGLGRSFSTVAKLFVFFVTKDSYFKAKVDFRDELPRCSAKNKKPVKISAIIITFYVRNNRVFLASAKIMICRIRVKTMYTKRKPNMDPGARGASQGPGALLGPKGALWGPSGP